jgi:copper chaperone NosL
MAWIAGCSAPGPSPIAYGTDACDYCRMTIADEAFGSERVTTKGKVYKFDSIECMAASDLDAHEDQAPVRSRWVTDFAHPGRFLDLEQAFIVATERVKSPMGVGLVAVGTPEEAERLTSEQGGRIISWDEARRLVAGQWNLDQAR